MKAKILKRRSFIRLLLFLVFGFSSVNMAAKNNRFTTDSLKVKPFEQLMVVGDIQTSVVLCQSRDYAITVSGCKLPDVKVETANSTLMIFSNVRESSAPIQITIYAPEWKSILCSIVEKMQTKGRIAADDLQINVNIAKLLNLDVQSVNLNIQTTDVEKCVLNGSCNNATIDFGGTANGSSELHAEKLQVSLLNLSGVVESKAFVHALDSIYLQKCLSSDITIWGSPSNLKNDTKSCAIHLIPSE